MDIVGGMVEDEVAVGLGLLIEDELVVLQVREGTLGKHSLSKTKACSNCPQAKGINIQLPHHHGLFLNHPSSSNALYANSNDLVATYIAIVIRN